MASDPTTPAIIIRAAAVNEESVCQSVSTEQAVSLVRNSSLPVWVDIVTDPTVEAAKLLKDSFGFHELAVEDALSRNERPQLQQYGDILFFSVAVITNINSAEGEEKYEEIGFFLGQNFLVTVSPQRFPAVDSVFDDWTRAHGRLSRGPAFAAHAVIDHVIDQFFPALDKIEDRVEDAFDLLAEGAQIEMGAILRSKRDLAAMRRRLNPTRDVLNALLRLGDPELRSETLPYFRDVLDHTLRLLEMIDENRDMVGSLLDVHLSQVSNSLSVTVKKMTVFSTVLMTMALVAGIYGMNFDHMPELHWQFGYLFAILLMFVVGSLVVVGFWIAKWL